MKKVKTQQDISGAYAGGGVGLESVADNSAGVLQALIDLYSQPVYIKGPSGMLLNQEAERMVHEGALLPTGDVPVNLFMFRGKKWRCERRDMNHNTGCVLYKLDSDHSDDPQIRRARECMMRLDTFFGAPPLETPSI